MRISALTFAYNEADKMETCLRSIAKWVDEIIVFDLESTDNTQIIARHFTDRIFLRPYLLVGDGYKHELVTFATGDWLLWFYADETFSPLFGPISRKLIEVKEYNVFQFLRREFVDGVRVGYNGPDGLSPTVQFGTPECPNYQSRLVRKTAELFYTELIHADVFGEVHTCMAPPECYIEHRKSSKDQEFDNIRSCLWYKLMIFKYGGTKFYPYSSFVESYKQMIHDNEMKNLSGERKISLMEEFWFNWRNYANIGRITSQEFKEVIGISYEDFLNSKGKTLGDKIMIEENVRDRILDGKIDKKYESRP